MMSRIVLVCVFIGVSFSTSFAGTPLLPQLKALVVGNAAYYGALSLNNTVTDAKAVANVLNRA